MAEGLRDVWSLGDPQRRPSPQEAETFKRQFQEHLSRINVALQYTAANGDALRHQEQIAKRDKLFSIYQAVLGKYESSDPAAAKTAADKALAATQGAADGAAKYHAEVQRSAEDWKTKGTSYDDALDKVAQLEEWGDPKAATLRTILTKIQQQADQKQFGQAVQAFDQVAPKIEPLYEQAKQKTSAEGQVVRTETILEASGSYEEGSGYDPATGKYVSGVAMKGEATAYGVKKEGGPVTGTVKFGHAEGELKYGEHYDPQTGAHFVGAKASGKVVAFEESADTPIGKVEGAIGKLEGEAVFGYEYDPEKKVEFAGVKVKGSVSAFEGKIEGKYGKLDGKFLSAGVESKTGLEYDEKSGKWFIGTANKAEAAVADVSAVLKTSDDSFKLIGEAQVLKAEATLDANVVVDKYGIDLNAKAGAEANLYKVGIGGEVRLTPKSLFDNTIGAIFDMEAPDYLDIGPVLGAKVSEGKGVGGTLEGGGRLGVDEINARAGGFIELGEGIGLDLKGGFRLGPLKYAVDHWDEIKKDAGDAQQWASERLTEAQNWAEEQVDAAGEWASEQVDTVQDWAQEQLDSAQEWASEKGSQLSDWASEQVDAVQDWAEKQAEQAERDREERARQIESVETWVKEQATDAADWVNEQADAVQDWASEKATEIEQAATEQVEAAQQWASETASDVADAASEAADTAVQAASDAKDWIAEQASSTWDTLFG